MVSSDNIHFFAPFLSQFPFSFSFFFLVLIAKLRLWVFGFRFRLPRDDGKASERQFLLPRIGDGVLSFFSLPFFFGLWCWLSPDSFPFPRHRQASIPSPSSLLWGQKRIRIVRGRLGGGRGMGMGMGGWWREREGVRGREKTRRVALEKRKKIDGREGGGRKEKKRKLIRCSK